MPINIIPSAWGIDPPKYVRICRRIVRKIIPLFYFAKSKKRILLFVHSPMMLRFLFDVHDAIKDSENFIFFCTSKFSPVDSGFIIKYCENSGVPYIHPFIASLRKWDLVLCAEDIHEYWFLPETPVILHFHGIDFGKKIPNTNMIYKYAKAVEYTKKNKGKFLYQSIFEASKHNKTNVSNLFPYLSSSLTVVGDLRADRLLEMTRDREKVREQFGIHKDEKVILILSTWGDESLMESMGQELIQEALKLKNRYKFIISTHPNHWSIQTKRKASIGPELLKYEREGFIIHRQPDDCLPYITMADVAIVDFSSMILYLALIKTPMTLISFPEHILDKNSHRYTLYHSLSKIYRASQLNEKIDHMLNENYSHIYDKLLPKILSYPGQSKARIRSEIKRLLTKEEEVVNTQ